MAGRREAVRVKRAELVQIMAAGQAARAAGEPATVCPYSAAGDATERVRVQAWLRGFLRGEPSEQA